MHTRKKNVLTVHVVTLENGSICENMKCHSCNSLLTGSSLTDLTQEVCLFCLACNAHSKTHLGETPKPSLVFVLY